MVCKLRAVPSTIIKKSVNLVELLIIVSLVAIIFGIFGQVLLRYVFKAPLTGFEETVCIVAAWLWFSTIAYSAYTRVHVSSIFPIRNRSAQRIFGIVRPCFCLVVTLVFVYFSYQYCHWTYTMGVSTVALRTPLIFSAAAILFGLALVAVYFGYEIVAKLSAYRSCDEEASDRGELK